jgi:hypothetical protein
MADYKPIKLLVKIKVGNMNRLNILIFALLILFSAACKEQHSEAATEKSAGTPVGVTTIEFKDLAECIELNATSVFLQKSYVKSITNGYIKTVQTFPGKYVSKGQLLFTIQTKESQTIGNAVNKIDPTFKFSGIIQVKAAESGYISQLNHQLGDYVQDGEQLAVINNANTFAFILNLPFELKPYLSLNPTLEMLLPDSTKLIGTISSEMPLVDPTSQVQSIVLKVNSNKQIPENLIAKVFFKKKQKKHSIALPKQAVLTNDIQSEFWVMKLMDSTTAAKVVVKKGLETDGWIEILEPEFTEADKILCSGNYGLPDTAKVQIQH